jgi:hypothetical protein
MPDHRRCENNLLEQQAISGIAKKVVLPKK